MFGTLGGPELFLILVIALIVFGPRRLPEMGKNFGRMLAEFRKASNEFQRTIQEEIESEKTAPPAPALAAPAAAVAPAGAPPAEAPADTVSRGTPPDAIEPK